MVSVLSSPIALILEQSNLVIEFPSRVLEVIVIGLLWSILVPLSELAHDLLCPEVAGTAFLVTCVSSWVEGYLGWEVLLLKSIVDMQSELPALFLLEILVATAEGK